MAAESRTAHAAERERYCAARPATGGTAVDRRLLISWCWWYLRRGKMADISGSPNPGFAVRARPEDMFATAPFLVFLGVYLAE